MFLRWNSRGRILNAVHDLPQSRLNQPARPGATRGQVSANPGPDNAEAPAAAGLSLLASGRGCPQGLAPRRRGRLGCRGRGGDECFTTLMMVIVLIEMLSDATRSEQVPCGAQVDAVAVPAFIGHVRFFCRSTAVCPSALQVRRRRCSRSSSAAGQARGRCRRSPSASPPPPTRGRPCRPGWASSPSSRPWTDESKGSTAPDRG